MGTFYGNMMDWALLADREDSGTLLGSALQWAQAWAAPALVEEMRRLADLVQSADGDSLLADLLQATDEMAASMAGIAGSLEALAGALESLRADVERMQG